MVSSNIEFYTDDGATYYQAQIAPVKSVTTSNENWSCSRGGKILLSILGVVMLSLIIIPLCCLLGKKPPGPKIALSCEKIEHVLKEYSEIDESFLPDPCMTYEWYYVLNWYIGLVSSKYLCDSILTIHLYGAKGKEITITWPGVNNTYTSDEDILKVQLPDTPEEITISFLDKEYLVNTVSSDWYFEPNYVSNGQLEIPYGLDTITSTMFPDKGIISNVIIPPTVREIQDEAFRESMLTYLIIPEGCTTLGLGIVYGTKVKYVILPETINLLNGNPFYHCESLESFYAPRGKYTEYDGFLVDNQTATVIATTKSSRKIQILPEITEVGPYSYAGNTDFNSLLCGVNVMIISDHSFEGCSELTQIQLQDSVNKIGNYAFRGTRLKTISITDSVEEIGEGAFYGIVELESVLFNDTSSLRTIGKRAFYGTSIKGIHIPESLLTIGTEAFANSPLETVIFPVNSKLDEIGDGAFSYSRLNEFHIPSELKRMGINPFEGCSDITSLDSDSANFDIIGKSLYSDGGTVLISYVCGLDGPSDFFVVPKSVKTIKNRAFYNIASIKSINFETDGILTDIGAYSFSKSGIRSINIPNTVVTIDDNAFSGSSLESVTFNEKAVLENIGRSAFANTYVEDVTIPSSVTIVGDDAFLTSTPQFKLVAKINLDGGTFLTTQDCSDGEIDVYECNCTRVVGDTGSCEEK